MLRMSMTPTLSPVSVLVPIGGMEVGGVRACSVTISVSIMPSVGGTTGLKVLSAGSSNQALYRGAEICGFGAARLASVHGTIVAAELSNRHSVQLTSIRPVPSHSG